MCLGIKEAKHLLFLLLCFPCGSCGPVKRSIRGVCNGWWSTVQTQPLQILMATLRSSSSTDWLDWWMMWYGSHCIRKKVKGPLVSSRYMQAHGFASWSVCTLGIDVSLKPWYFPRVSHWSALISCACCSTIHFGKKDYPVLLKANKPQNLESPSVMPQFFCRHDY